MNSSDSYITETVSLDGVTGWEGVAEFFQIVLRNTSNEDNNATINNTINLFFI